MKFDNTEACDRKILLLNAGSSSLKGTLIESAGATAIASGLADLGGLADTVSVQRPGWFSDLGESLLAGVPQAVQRFVYDLAHTEPIAVRDHVGFAAVGHRIVHGGPFTSSMRITPELRSRIAALADLAPQHNPPSLKALLAAKCELPDVPHVAVFDTAFHATLPPEAYTFPLP